jgi:hypothetical protein
MITEIELPTWATTCFKVPSHEAPRINFVELPDGRVRVLSCRCTEVDCFKCDPAGIILPINPLKLQTVEEIKSRDIPEKQCPDLTIPESYLAGRLKKYSESEEQFYSCDLDTIRIAKKADNSTSSISNQKSPDL